MRVIWNGICDPTLHVIAIALLLTGMGSVLTLNGSSAARVWSHQEVPLLHTLPLQCGYAVRRPHLVVASQNPTD